MNDPIGQFPFDEDFVKTAKEFAIMAHGDQMYDKTKPYSYHLEQVANNVAVRYDDNALTAAAWLHDVLEDTDTDDSTLIEKFGIKVTEIVREMTHDEKDTYSTYISRMGPEAQKIKIADLDCNILESTSKPRLSGYEKQRLDKYRMARRYLCACNVYHGEGLCYRCEHRARFMEQGHGPRCECGDYRTTKHGCYMYMPVRPVLIAPDEGDDRPMFGPAMIAARAHFKRVLEDKKDIKVSLGKTDDGDVFMVWVPKNG